MISTRKVFILYLMVALIGFFSYPQVAKAASLTAISDVMTRIKAATVSSHDITFTLGAATTLDAGETVIIDFDEDGGKFTVGGAATVVGDLDFNDGTERVIFNVAAATDCTGSVGVNDLSVGIVDATGVVTFLACPSFTASGAAAVVNVEYGTAAGGTNRVTNPAVSVPVISITAAADTGSFAAAIITDDQVVVTTTIDPYLTFTLTTTAVTLTKAGGGNPDYNNTGFNQGAANTLAATTNGASGYSISYNGGTLTRNGGAQTIDAMAVKAVSSTATEQFGINLRDNATPNTGTDPAGGSGTPAADYNTVDQYKFAAGATTALASAAVPSVTTTFTVTYIVNVTAVTEAGTYSTTVTYIATGNF